MGIFSTIVGTFQQANQMAHGERQAKEMAETLYCVEHLNLFVRVEAMHRFVEQRKTILADHDNVTHEGLLQIAQKLQLQAKRLFDSDQVKS